MASQLDDDFEVLSSRVAGMFCEGSGFKLPSSSFSQVTVSWMEQKPALVGKDQLVTF